MNDEMITKARLKDLANRAYSQNVYSYSNFLTPGELKWLYDIKRDIGYVDFSLFDEEGLCERQMVCFGSEEMFGYPPDFPVSLICVEPLIDKFSDVLSHRDFLGSVMNLGIERNVLGDILVKDNKKAYIYCIRGIGEFLCDNLTRIKHTNVKCHICDSEEKAAQSGREFEELSVVVSSPRFDAIIAGALRLSRGDTLKLFCNGKVSLNGILCEKNSITLKENDRFSIRGYGKFIFHGLGNETRKGRIYVHLNKFC